MDPVDRSPTQVVAAIVRDADGRVLLTQRGAQRDFPGAWEFPGGKLEPTEDATQALRRELREELGIDVDASVELIRVPHAYPHKRIVLDAHVVTAYRGTPHGREGQAVAWSRLDDLRRYAMPPADLPIVAALQQPDRYLITPEPTLDDRVFLAALERALQRGVRRVQLRALEVDAHRLEALAATAATLCAGHDTQLLLNAGHAAADAIATALGLGLHLPARRLRHPPDVAPSLLAASCHDADELALARDIGCGFVVLGPVAATASHPGAPALGWSGFAALREHSDLPIYALGGMRPDMLALARRHGAQGIAAIRALWPGADAANPAVR